MCGFLKHILKHILKHLQLLSFTVGSAALRELRLPELHADHVEPGQPRGFHVELHHSNLLLIHIGIAHIPTRV